MKNEKIKLDSRCKYILAIFVVALLMIGRSQKAVGQHNLKEIPVEKPRVQIPDNYLKDDHRRPKEENSVHVILEVKDDGSPALRSYRRVIIDIINE